MSFFKYCVAPQNFMMYKINVTFSNLCWIGIFFKYWKFGCLLKVFLFIKRLSMKKLTFFIKFRAFESKFLLNSVLKYSNEETFKYYAMLGEGRLRKCLKREVEVEKLASRNI